MSLETVGANATLSWCATSGGTFAALAKVLDITPNKISSKAVETTKIDSAADESQPGTPDYGEVAATVVYSAALTAIVNNWIATKAIVFFKLTVDDSTTTDSSQAFSAWCKEFEPMAGDLKKDEMAKSKLVLKITGVAAFTGATS